MRQTRWKAPLLLLITVAAGLAQTELSLFRPGFVFLFLLLCPGSALIGVPGFKNPVTDWVLSIALSLALLALLSQFIVLTGVWSLETGFWILNTVSLLGLGWQTWRHRGSFGAQSVPTEP